MTDPGSVQERIRESEARFRALAENATVAIFVIDEGSTIEFANPAAERIFGYTVAEMLGEPLDMLMPKDQRPLHDAGIRRYLETGRRNIAWEGVELPGLTRDGNRIPLEISMGEFVQDGRHYFTGIARDITERKLAEEALRESEGRYRLLADMIPQHIWITDPQGFHSYFSRRWYEFTGATPEETEGEGWIALLHPEDRARTLARWEQSLRSGRPYAIEYRFRNVRGEYCWFLGQAVPQRNEAGEIVRWFGTLTDITERKRLDAEREELLRRAQEARAEAEGRREELERVTESRTRLMRGFSHDVKNPLGAADGHAQLLEDGILGELTDKQQDSIRRIRGSIRTSLRLIDDLLELARAEAGQIEIRCVETDVTRAALEVAEDFRAQGEAAGVDIDVQGSAGVRADTDPTRVRQILANLLSNAVKYAPHGPATLTVRPAENGNGPNPGSWIALSVTDTGPGIPEAKKELIFEEFTRLDPEAQSGAGVGLAISRRIARLLGGDLTVESEPGRGSTFTLWLPPAA